jgi:probable F420-dependent oxidoreductase
MDVGRLGVWWSRTWRGPDPSIDTAAELESLGYRALWSSGGFQPGLAARFGRLLASTRELVVASGIVSIWLTPAPELAEAVGTLEAEHPGRFLLGLGVSHGPIVPNYDRPYGHMVRFLDELDAATPAVPANRRVLAALGDRMLGLAARRAAGAHPYFVPAEHTARAREVLGEGPLLAPEVTVVVERDPTTAREIARGFTAGYLALPNYANNLRRLGFSDDDVAGAGSNRLLDAVVCWGDAETVAGRVARHFEAGADHVCLQVVTGSSEEFPLAQYRELATAILR